jgi:hypothetical protein
MVLRQWAAVGQEVVGKKITYVGCKRLQVLTISPVY